MAYRRNHRLPAVLWQVAIQIAWLDCQLEGKWYYVQNVVHSPELIKTFHDNYLEKPGPLKRLQVWLDTQAKEDEGGEVYEAIPEDDFLQLLISTSTAPKKGRKRH
ncbi:hypothetical protein GQ43DRAFT_464256 [Delitschia confertaspora ATCC 74209]|uniref:Uncharacterized protein n=1 Tax=Delitschia confertaspora ATCC 74209 TaxID=1513339 RepID=A0A9P4JKV1_9PLEO|nr:hypothetical protein GQ43DRAFT_464256 [Delitschia confertaspora ATCC 74209]